MAAFSSAMASQDWSSKCASERPSVIKISCLQYRTYFLLNTLSRNVSISGVILINSRTIEAIVISRIFPETALTTRRTVYDWMYKYKLSAPLVAYGTTFNFTELNIYLDGKKTNKVYLLSSFILQ
ncbi:uncharacterized protein LOC105423996 [Pogonomyrmex barbatus]|uniref:Uncharacterized protein LOC105423996 n=1 Tax=Pogonomyrmex barbatus TaxID=144034 RepID=A0A6I9WKN3_9HYME|nr:uncharacterized protein LOC105423996 [Pogonomyrmex barbatus]